MKAIRVLAAVVGLALMSVWSAAADPIGKSPFLFDQPDHATYREAGKIVDAGGMVLVCVDSPAKSLAGFTTVTTTVRETASKNGEHLAPGYHLCYRLNGKAVTRPLDGTPVSAAIVKNAAACAHCGNGCTCKPGDGCDDENCPANKIPALNLPTVPAPAPARTYPAFESTPYPTAAPEPIPTAGTVTTVYRSQPAAVQFDNSGRFFQRLRSTTTRSRATGTTCTGPGCGG